MDENDERVVKIRDRNVNLDKITQQYAGAEAIFEGISNYY